MDQVCPHFFKVFFPNLYSHHLRIPPAFEKRMAGDASTVFSLEGPSGRAWNLGLVRDAAGMRFVCGWREFVAGNALAAGDFLVFKYEGPSKFKVLIFDESSCLKDIAAPSRHAIQADREVVLMQDEEPPKRKRGRPPKQNGLLKKSDDHLMNNGTRADRYENHGDFQRDRKPTVVQNGHLLNSAHCASFESPQKSRRNQSSSSLEQRCLVKKEADTPEITESGKICVLQIGSLSSKRRPVTKAEINKTLKNARSFKSKRPYVAIFMSNSYVYTRLFLKIPWPFARKHLLCDGKINLQDSKGKTWTVSYTHNENNGGIGAGWGEFSYAHNLEKGDVCIFELIAKSVLHVHIYRVVEELTPLTKVFEHHA